MIVCKATSALRQNLTYFILISVIIATYNQKILSFLHKKIPLFFTATNARISFYSASVAKNISLQITKIFHEVSSNLINQRDL